MSKVLVKFEGYNGRAGVLDALFITTREELEGLYGKTVVFGEVLGKHSEVVLDIEESHFDVIDLGAEAIEKLEAAAGTSISGHNPFDYYDPDDDEDDEEEEEDDE